MAEQRLAGETEVNIQALEAGTRGLRRLQDAICICRDGIRKAKVEMEPNFIRDVENSKAFFRNIGQKKQVKESVIPFIIEKGKMVTEKRVALCHILIYRPVIN